MKMTPKAFIALAHKAEQILLKAYRQIRDESDPDIVRTAMAKMDKRLDYLKHNPNTREVYAWMMSEGYNQHLMDNIGELADYILGYTGTIDETECPF